MNYKLHPQAMPIFIYDQQDFTSDSNFRLVLMQGTSAKTKLKVLEGKVNGFSRTGIKFTSYNEGNLRDGDFNLQPKEVSRTIPYSRIGMAEKIAFRN